MQEYKKMIFFSKEAQQKFDEADSEVQKATMRLLQENVEETKMKIEKELQQSQKERVR